MNIEVNVSLLHAIQIWVVSNDGPSSLEISTSEVAIKHVFDWSLKLAFMSRSYTEAKDS